MKGSENPDSRLGARWRDYPVSRLRLIGLMEGTTLLVLLFIAVPLKHLFDQPGLVSIMGPVHGLAFVSYLVAIVDTVSGGGFTSRDTLRLMVVSLIPFGPFLNDRFLAHHQLAALNDK